MVLPNTKIADRFFFWLTILGTAFALFMHYGIHKTNVEERDWREAAEYVNLHFKRGDAVAVWPTWALRGAQFIQRETILYSYDLTPERLRKFRRLWLVVAPHLGKWWFKRAFSKELAELKKLYWLKEKKSVGQLEVYLFKLPPSPPILYQFADKGALRRAEVGLEAVSSAGCPKFYPGYRFWLSKWIDRPGWWTSPFDRFYWRNPPPRELRPKLHRFFVGRILLEVGDEPHLCIWAPTHRCYRTVIRFRNVPLRGRLFLNYGIGTPAPSKVLPTIPPSAPPVRISLYSENRFLNSWTAVQDRWLRSELNLSSQNSYSKSVRKGSLLFKIESIPPTRPNVGFCFAGYIR